jgi:hypothetical protein
MNSTSGTTLIELRIARAYVNLSSIPEDSSETSVSLAAIGNCEIRMFRGREADLDSAAFWFELLNHDTKTSADRFQCHTIQDAAPVFENFISEAATYLNEPQPGGPE